MTLASNTTRIDYNGDGSQTSFPVPFLFLAYEHLAVYLINQTTNVETIQVLNTDYTVAGANDPLGGTVSMTVAPAANERLTIIRDVPYDQLVNLRENDAFSANRTEFMVDKLTMLLQQTEERIRRGILLKVTTPVGSEVFPDRTGFTQTFVGKITAVDPDNAGQYLFTEQMPSGLTFVARSGGISGSAVPLPHCLSDWTSDLPLFVFVHVFVDEDGVTTYHFEPPPPCSVEA